MSWNCLCFTEPEEICWASRWKGLHPKSHPVSATIVVMIAAGHSIYKPLRCCSISSFLSHHHHTHHFQPFLSHRHKNHFQALCHLNTLIVFRISWSPFINQSFAFLPLVQLNPFSQNKQKWSPPSSLLPFSQLLLPRLQYPKALSTSSSNWMHRPYQQQPSASHLALSLTHPVRPFIIPTCQSDNKNPPLTLSTGLPSGFELSVNGASGISIPDQSIVCQAFKDTAGTIRLGGTFDETLPGTKISTTADAVQIGSIFCSNAAGVQAQINRSSAAKPAPPAAFPKGIARIQLDFDSEGAAQGDVTLDNSIVPIRGNFATRTASSAFIVSATGVQEDKISCQAWKDEQATQKLGKPFSGSDEAVFSDDGTPVSIGSLKCKIIWEKSNIFPIERNIRIKWGVLTLLLLSLPSLPLSPPLYP